MSSFCNNAASRRATPAAARAARGAARSLHRRTGRPAVVCCVRAESTRAQPRRCRADPPSPDANRRSRQRADLERLRGADLGALADRDDAEAIGAPQAARDHVEIARLEDPQRERSAGEHHGLERKQRDLDVLTRPPASSRSMRAAGAAPQGLLRARGRPSKLPFDISTTWSPAASSPSSALASRRRRPSRRASRRAARASRRIPAELRRAEHEHAVGGCERAPAARLGERPCAWCSSAAPSPRRCAAAAPGRACAASVIAIAVG